MQRIDPLPSYQYLAGLFDGEGSIAISKRKVSLKDGSRAPWYILVVCLVNTHLPIIVTVREMFGTGSKKQLYRVASDPSGIILKPYKKPRRKCYMWHATSDIAENFLHCIYPYLIIKKDEVELAFQFREHVRRYKHAHRRFNSPRNEHGVYTAWTDDWFASELYRKIQSEREAMYQQMKALKRPVFADYSGMTANSGKLPCPDLDEVAEGQSRAKQGESPGVRNEQVLSSKEKVCSELHGNMQSAAERPRRISFGLSSNKLT